mgnify:CR=1 FL=1
MGLYNNITTDQKLTCPFCNKEMPEQWYQSKETFVNGIEIEPSMESIKLEDITSGEMHGGCDKCNAFIQFNIKDGKIIDTEKRDIFGPLLDKNNNW